MGINLENGVTMSKDLNKSQNNRKLRAETDRKMLWMVVLTLVVFGSILIGLVYGVTAIIAALPFLLLGALAIGILFLILKGIDYLLKRYY
ncbi:MAG: hypothetical protein DWQ04_16285 [Chloroflexi bacterium]|nr:MAG: hypothetical protein DWQ04_16285 [Chloroflexota bacterium]